MQIYHMQQVQITIAGGAASGNGTLSGFNNVDKMVVFASWTLPAIGSLIGAKAFVDFDITTTTNITASRTDSTAGESITIEAFVIQFGDDTNVYKGAFTIASTVLTLDTNVNGGSPMALNDLTKAFCWCYHKTDNTGGTADFQPGLDTFSMFFTSTSAVQMNRYSPGTGNITGHWFVVESSTLSVQHDTFDTSTGDSSYTDTFTTPVTMSNSFVLGSTFTSQSTYHDEGIWTIALVDDANDNSVQVRRGDGGSHARSHYYQVISDTGISVQRGDFTHNATSNTATLSPAVDTSRTIAILNGTASPRAAGNQFSAGHADEYHNRAWISDSTTLNVASTSAGSGMIMPWQVIQFTAESAPPATRRIMVIT
jgi:hypothetical protein